ncbi:MAG TPA: protease inhibitor I42 family protein [Gaiellaceae bacterium]|nr:protease inhibitor I42 family protein [Gaiellaceae bacterium]
MFALLTLLAALQLTAKDNHKSFTVKPQRAIVVTLVSNSSTGYHWKYKPSSGGGKVVKLVSHRYVPPQSGRPGAAGKEIWHFRAVGKGVMDMGFRYIRSWLPNKPAKRIEFSIRVR